MDLESENSALESTGDNDLVYSAADPPIGEESDDVKLNGSCIKADLTIWNMLSSEERDLYSRNFWLPVKEAENAQSVGVGSPTTSSPVTGEKGKGLRRWRRIRRDSWDDNGTGTPSGVGNVEATKLLKRGLANLGSSMEVAADRHKIEAESDGEGEGEGEGSVSSTNAFVNNPVGAKSFSNGGSAYEVVGVSTFNVGADSGNSEDRSSKSSTAASVPKSRLDQPRAQGHSREKYKLKHVGRKSVGSAPQAVQQSPRQLDGGKKSRGEAFNNDKENSLSSLESDSRNYPSAFMRGLSSAVSNGSNGRLMGSDGERSDDEPAGEEQSVEGLTNGHSGSVGGAEETSRGDAALSSQIEENTKNRNIVGNGDPLVDCVHMLESVQQGLEQELHRFIELGKNLQPLDDDLIKATCLPIFSKSGGSEIQSAASNQPTINSLDSFNNKLVGQAPNVEALATQLEETTTILKEKESMIFELEATINQIKSCSEDLGNSVQAEQKKYSEIELEMETLFMQKTEAEILYLAIADKSTIAEGQMQLLLAKQEEERNMKDDQESKAALLMDKTEEGLSTGKVTSKAEIRKMQNRVTKFSFCFLVQLILLVFVAELFWSQLLPKSEDVAIPT